MSALASKEDQQEWNCGAVEELVSIKSTGLPPQISSAIVPWAKCSLVAGLDWVCSRSTFQNVVSSVDNLICIFHNLNQSIATEEEQGICLRKALLIQIQASK